MVQDVRFAYLETSSGRWAGQRECRSEILPRHALCWQAQTVGQGEQEEARRRRGTEHQWPSGSADGGGEDNNSDDDDDEDDSSRSKSHS